MQVARLRDFGGSDVFEIVDVPRPIPEPGEFRVRVTACGVCGHDVLARRGELSAEKHAILGHEIAGVVEQVGDESLQHWLGLRVALTQRRSCGKCADCVRGATNQCREGAGFYGDDSQGGYAEFVLADPSNTVPIPDEISDELAAVLSCGVGTGYRALTAAKARVGDVVLITGASGGVGLNAVATARALELTPIAIVSDERKVDATRAAGAETVLVNPTAREIRDVAKRLGRPRGVDIALELTGAPTFALSLRSIRPNGHLVLIGNVQPDREIILPAGYIILRELHVLGSAHATRDDLEAVLELVASRRLQPPSVTPFSLEQVSDVHQQLDNRTLIGRAVVVP